MPELLLHEIDDIEDYLQALESYKNKCLICAVAKDTLHGIHEEAIDALKRFGMKNVPKGWNGYIFLMEKGKVYLDIKSASNVPLMEHVKLEAGDVQIISAAYQVGARCAIVLDGIDLSVSRRGLNIVVFDIKKRKLMDSVEFDFMPGEKDAVNHKIDFINMPVPRMIENDEKCSYDINGEFNEIIFRYRLEEFYPRYLETQMSREIIREVANNWKENEFIACIVVGFDDKKMDLDESWFLDSLSLYQKNQITFFRCGQNTDGGRSGYSYAWEAYDFKILERVIWDVYSHVYIISNQGENFVGLWFRKHNVPYESLCDIFAARGIVGVPAQVEYYDFIPDKRESRFFYDDHQTSPVQWEYFEQSAKYHTYKLDELRNICAKKCFFLSLVLKNFLHAEEWLNKIVEQDDSCERYYEAWNCIKNLLGEIRIRLKKRQQRDVLAIWVDHTLFEDLSLMPFVSSLSDKSIWFENIFTLTGYTRETLRGLFTGRRLIDDLTGEIKNINLSNSPVLRKLAEYGYRIKILMKEFRTMFPRSYWVDYSMYDFIQTSEMLWDGISQLLTYNNPVFILIPIEETHPPYISLRIKDENVFEYYSRMELAYKESDDQIKFYTDLLGKNSTSIIFSDHGGSHFWPRQHVFLSVYGGGYKPKKVKGLCSSIDFHKIITYVINGDDVEEKELARTFCEIQGVPIVSGRMHITGDGVLTQAEPAFWPPFRGYKGVVTNDYVYIHFAGGREWLSRRDKLQPNLSWYQRPDDICDEKLLPEFRKKAGVNYGDEPFDYGRISNFYSVTMKAYEENYIYNERKISLINKLVAGMPNASVGLYLGNGVSREIYLALSMDSRIKVACVIDNEKKCACKDLDIPIITLSEAKEQGCCNILTGTRSLPPELNEFLKKDGEGIHVYGLYGWFELNGYYTKYCFYDFVIQSMDEPLSSPIAIPDFLHQASRNCYCEVSVIMVVQDVNKLLERLHNILKQIVLGIRVYCLDLTGKASDVVKEYQKIDSSIEVIMVESYASLPIKMNELISIVNTRYIFFLSDDEYLHSKGLFYLHELAEQTEADVVAASAVLRADKKENTNLADFAEGTFELKKEARILPATFKERYVEWDETEIPDIAGNKLYRVDFLRKHGIRFQDIKSGWKDIFCLQTIFGAPKYVKAISPVCISSGNATGATLEDNSAEYAKKLVESMFSYQQVIEAMLRHWRGFGNNPSLCDKFRERAMTIFDQQYFSDMALDDDMRRSVSQTVQEELQKNPSIGIWWIRYLFMRSSFPQDV